MNIKSGCCYSAKQGFSEKNTTVLQEITDLYFAYPLNNYEKYFNIKYCNSTKISCFPGYTKKDNFKKV